MNSSFEVLWKSAVTHTYWGKIALVTSAKTTMTTAITKKRVVNKDYRHDMTQCRMMKTLMGNLLSIFWGLTGCNEIDPQYPLCDSMEWGLSTLQWQNANSGVCWASDPAQSLRFWNQPSKCMKQTNGNLTDWSRHSWNVIPPVLGREDARKPAALNKGRWGLNQIGTPTWKAWRYQARTRWRRPSCWYSVPPSASTP